jgi:hypothetical protein
LPAHLSDIKNVEAHKHERVVLTKSRIPMIKEVIHPFFEVWASVVATTGTIGKESWKGTGPESRVMVAADFCITV